MGRRRCCCAGGIACLPCTLPEVDLWVTGRLGTAGAVFYDAAMPYQGGLIWQSACHATGTAWISFRLACTGGVLSWRLQQWTPGCGAPTGVTSQLYPPGGGWTPVTLQCSPFLLVVRPTSSPPGFGDHYTVSE